MISLDQWDREGLEKLRVPELIQDYLSYLEYGELGDVVRYIVQEGKNFVRTGCCKEFYENMLSLRRRNFSSRHNK